MQEWNFARHEERRAVQRDGNFVGVLFLAMMAVQIVIRTAVQLGAFRGLTALIGTHEGIMVLNMILYVLELAVPAVAVALLMGRRQNPFPAKRVNGSLWVVSVLGGMAFSIVANLATGWLMNWLSALGIPEPDLPETVLPTVSSLAVNLIATAVLPALIEEMIFRGYMLGALRAHGDGLAVVLTAVLFGVFHGNVLQLPFALILGLVLGYLTVQTESIWPAVLLHFTNNAMSVLLSYCGERFPDQAGTVNGLTFLAISALGAAVLTALLWHREQLVPIGNRYALLRVSERVTAILTSPALIAAEVLMVLTLLQSIGGTA